MEKWENLLYLLPLAVSLVSTIIAIIKGLTSKKRNKSLSEVEQRNDLFNYMVSEAIRVEQFAQFLKNSMTKDVLREWKKTEVLKNLSLYASANSYTWYIKSEWEQQLTDYIACANQASGKSIVEKTATPNAG